MAKSIETRAFIGKNTQESSPSISPERPSLHLARTVQSVSDQLNALPLAERTVMDPRYEAVLEVVKDLPGTQSWRSAVKRFITQNYPLGDGPDNNIRLAEHLGIDLKNNAAGACSLGEARSHELREFMINVHGSIRGYIGRGEIAQAEKSYRSFSTWSNEFHDVYSGYPYPTEDDPSERNIRMALKSDESIAAWMSRQSDYQEFFQQRPNELDNDHISP